MYEFDYDYNAAGYQCFVRCPICRRRVNAADPLATHCLHLVAHEEHGPDDQWVRFASEELMAILSSTISTLRDCPPVVQLIGQDLVESHPMLRRGVQAQTWSPEIIAESLVHEFCIDFVHGLPGVKSECRWPNMAWGFTCYFIDDDTELNRRAGAAQDLVAAELSDVLGRIKALQNAS